jgi:hypothetical protein
MLSTVISDAEGCVKGEFALDPFGMGTASRRNTPWGGYGILSEKEKI